MIYDKQTNQVAPGVTNLGSAPPGRYCPSQRPVPRRPSTVVRLSYSGPGPALARYSGTRLGAHSGRAASSSSSMFSFPDSVGVGRGGIMIMILSARRCQCRRHGPHLPVLARLGLSRPPSSLAGQTTKVAAPEPCDGRLRPPLAVRTRTSTVHWQQHIGNLKDQVWTFKLK